MAACGEGGQCYVKNDGVSPFNGTVLVRLLAYIHPSIHTYILYIHTYTLTHILTYIHTYIHTHMLTYINTYILTYTNMYH